MAIENMPKYEKKTGSTGCVMNGFKLPVLSIQPDGLPNQTEERTNVVVAVVAADASLGQYTVAVECESWSQVDFCKFQSSMNHAIRNLGVQL